MTREEAIKAIKSHCYFANLVPVGKEALDVAIKALEQERIRSAEITQYRHDCEKLMEENEWLKKAIEQEPCDCISRSELLKAVDTWDKFGCDADLKLVPVKDCYVPYIHYDDVVKAIKGMPSVQSKTEWIPVSERLPEDKTYVLTTIKIPNRIAHARSGWYESGFFHNDNGDVWKATDMEVVAWMPLPEPYTAEKE